MKIDMYFLPTLIIHSIAMIITLRKDITQKKKYKDSKLINDWTEDDWKGDKPVIWRKVVRYLSQITILTNSIFLFYLIGKSFGIYKSLLPKMLNLFLPNSLTLIIMFWSLLAKNIDRNILIDYDCLHLHLMSGLLALKECYSTNHNYNPEYKLNMLWSLFLFAVIWINKLIRNVWTYGLFNFDSISGYKYFLTVITVSFLCTKGFSLLLN